MVVAAGGVSSKDAYSAAERLRYWLRYLGGSGKIKGEARDLPLRAASRCGLKLLSVSEVTAADYDRVSYQTTVARHTFTFTSDKLPTHSQTPGTLAIGTRGC